MSHFMFPTVNPQHYSQMTLTQILCKPNDFRYLTNPTHGMEF